VLDQFLFGVFIAWLLGFFVGFRPHTSSLRTDTVRKLFLALCLFVREPACLKSTWMGWTDVQISSRLTWWYSKPS
jgi:hypothetical protein